MKKKKNPILVAFGDGVRDLRLKKRMSQRKLAERSGLDPSYISGIERSVRNPSLKSLDRLAKGLGCSLAEVCRCLDRVSSEKSVAR